MFSSNPRYNWTLHEYFMSLKFSDVFIWIGMIWVTSIGGSWFFSDKEVEELESELTQTVPSKADQASIIAWLKQNEPRIKVKISGNEISFRINGLDKLHITQIRKEDAGFLYELRTKRASLLPFFPSNLLLNHTQVRRFVNILRVL